MQKIAVVILNWNGQEYLKRFLPALLDRTPSSLATIIVADNASTDGSLNYLQTNHPSIPLILLDKNYGFTGGYNRALAQLNGYDYYVLLNSDVEVTEHWIEPLFQFMESHPLCGICMPKVLSYNNPSYFEYAGAAGGCMDIFGFPFCYGRILSNIEADKGQYDTPRQVFWASGTCFFVRASLYRSLNGLDDMFFAHMEEIDFCWRTHNTGFQVWSLPQSCILHVGGGTLPNNSPRKLKLNYRNNLYMLYKNLPSDHFYPVLIMRGMIDMVAAFAYLLQGKPTFFAAVFKAYKEFFANRCRLQRGPCPSPRLLPGIYRGSIILKFFLSGKKLRTSTFSYSKKFPQ